MYSGPRSLALPYFRELGWTKQWEALRDVRSEDLSSWSANADAAFAVLQIADGRFSPAELWDERWDIFLEIKRNSPSCKSRAAAAAAAANVPATASARKWQRSYGDHPALSLGGTGTGAASVSKFDVRWRACPPAAAAVLAAMWRDECKAAETRATEGPPDAFGEAFVTSEESLPEDGPDAAFQAVKTGEGAFCSCITRARVSLLRGLEASTSTGAAKAETGKTGTETTTTVADAGVALQYFTDALSVGATAWIDWPLLLRALLGGAIAGKIWRESLPRASRGVAMLAGHVGTLTIAGVAALSGSACLEKLHVRSELASAMSSIAPAASRIVPLAILVSRTTMGAILGAGLQAVFLSGLLMGASPSRAHMGPGQLADLQRMTPTQAFAATTSSQGPRILRHPRELLQLYAFLLLVHFVMQAATAVIAVTEPNDAVARFGALVAVVAAALLVDWASKHQRLGSVATLSPVWHFARAQMAISRTGSGAIDAADVEPCPTDLWPAGSTQARAYERAALSAAQVDAILEAAVVRSLGPLRQLPAAYALALLRIAVYGHAVALLLAMRVHSPVVVLSTSMAVIVSLALAGVFQPNADSGNAAAAVAPAVAARQAAAAASASHHQRSGLCDTVCTAIMAPVTLPAFALTALWRLASAGPAGVISGVAFLAQSARWLVSAPLQAVTACTGFLVRLPMQLVAAAASGVATVAHSTVQLCTQLMAAATAAFASSAGRAVAVLALPLRLIRTGTVAAVAAASASVESLQQLPEMLAQPLVKRLAPSALLLAACAVSVFVTWPVAGLVDCAMLAWAVASSRVSWLPAFEALADAVAGAGAGATSRRNFRWAALACSALQLAALPMLLALYGGGADDPHASAAATGTAFGSIAALAALELRALRAARLFYTAATAVASIAMVAAPRQHTASISRVLSFAVLSGCATAALALVAVGGHILFAVPWASALGGRSSATGKLFALLLGAPWLAAVTAFFGWAAHCRDRLHICIDNTR